MAKALWSFGHSECSRVIGFHRTDSDIRDRSLDGITLFYSRKNMFVTKSIFCELSYELRQFYKGSLDNFFMDDCKKLSWNSQLKLTSSGALIS